MKERIRSLFTTIFIEKGQKKLLSLIAACCVWYFVNESITVTKTFASVAVYLDNIPANKTAEALLPSGQLAQHVTLTITGTKSVLEDLDANDLYVLIDAHDKPSEWVVSVSRKNVFTNSPDIRLWRHISHIDHSEFIVRLTDLVTERIPVYMKTPTGEAPQGYQFLDVWPQQLSQTLSGPQSQLRELKSKGLALRFHLSDITQAELDALQSSHPSRKDEVLFPIPKSWKKVAIPFQNNAEMYLTGSEAERMYIVLLRKSSMPLLGGIPVRLYFPPQYQKTMNADTLRIASNELVAVQNGQALLILPLFASGVSQQFLETVKDNIELTVTASPLSDVLSWTVQFVDPIGLETAYLAKVLAEINAQKMTHSDVLEQQLRDRFQNYMRQFKLVTSKNEALKLDITLKSALVTVKEGV